MLLTCGTGKLLETAKHIRVPFCLILFAGACLFSCDSHRVGSEDRAAQNLHVPEGFVIERAAPPGMVAHPYFATFDADGRLFVTESSGKTTSTEDVLKNPTFQILLLEDLDHDGFFDHRKVFADKVPYPMGSYFYRGSLYVTAPPDLLRFTDTNDDGVADKREVVLTGWTLNHNAATLSGPFFGPDGWMYMCDARRGFDIKTKEGTELKGKGARIWRCRPDGSGLESVSGGGFDNTVELIFMPSGETIGTMTYFTDPQNGYRDALMHWVEGGVYPKPYPVIEQDRLKLTGDLMPVMTKLARVSPAGLMRYRGAAFGDDFEGNLFSAQFNTGRIMRHVVSAEGASFQTTEEPFMQSDSLDTHPTDVLEDADGSLIVVNTGGWFIAGCPLSVVAKANVEGGLFRVRKAGAPEISDPRGRELDFKSMSPEELAVLISDRRPVVQDKAIEELVLRGEVSVPALRDLLASSGHQEDRLAGVFALYRIQGAGAMEGVVSALDDKSVSVRTAAARAAGLAREHKAVDKLMRLVQDDSPPVRRQAATALGQIGDPRALAALLEASANPEDRYVEHAIFYSLIVLGKEDSLLAALKHASPNVRRAALIALDQMEGSPVKKKHVVPFLQSKDSLMERTGVWVVAHHTDWGDAVIDYLGANLRKDALSAARRKMLADLMIRFIGDPPLQRFVAARLENPSTSSDNKLFLLNAVNQSPEKGLPRVWVEVLAKLLRSDNAELRSAVLDVIQSHDLPGFGSELERIAASDKASPAFRLRALGARINTEPRLSDREFRTVLQFMRPGNDPPLRQGAVRLLAQAKLNEAQLMVLAKEEVPNADVYLLASLADCFTGSNNEQVGKALVAALAGQQDHLDNLPVERFQKIIRSYPPSVHEAAQPVLKTLTERQASRLAELEKLQAALRTGDAGEGRKLFFGKATCSTCHSIIDQGGKFGPDLTNIGEIRSTHDLLEAILYPSASFAREYETSKVVTKTTAYSGIIRQQAGETLLMETGPGSSVRISLKEITSIEPESVSMMPPGLNKQLSEQEMSDLMAYLSTLPDGLGHLKSRAAD
ncbi:MAG TPA: PVC-type heme-binding CxxCH protein [Chryseosolibacter sp.]